MNGAFGGIARDQGIGPNEGSFRQLDSVRDRAVASQETAFSDDDIAVENHMGGQPHMVGDPGPVADLASAPDHGVIFDDSAVVDALVLQDDTVLADQNPLGNAIRGVHIAGKAVSGGFEVVEFLGPQAVHSLKSERNKGLNIAGGKSRSDITGRHHRKVLEPRGGHVLRVKNKADHIHIAIIGKIAKERLRSLARTENEDLTHDQPPA